MISRRRGGDELVNIHQAIGTNIGNGQIRLQQHNQSPSQQQNHHHVQPQQQTNTKNSVINRNDNRYVFLYLSLFPEAILNVNFILFQITFGL